MLSGLVPGSRSGPAAPAPTPSSALPLSGLAVLDYGCGAGDLAKCLLGAGARVAGIESSPGSVRRSNERFNSHPRWLGAFEAASALPPEHSGHFDLITCVEVVEHLDDATLQNVLSEILRLLKPGGMALYTTPNEERLENNFIYCPFCDTAFHQVQHMRTFDTTSLTTALNAAGFVVEFCQPINIVLLTPGLRSTLPRQSGLGGKTGRSVSNLARLAWRCRARALSLTNPRALRWYLHPGANLVALARSPSPASGR